MPRGKDKYVNGRDGVLSILLCVNEEGAFLDAALERVLSAREWTDEDRRFITRLSRGTIERQIEADARIGAVSTLPVRKMKPAIRNILRMSAYSLFYMDHIPARAVVNEAVSLAKLRAPKGLSGFVNGVLRKIARDAAQESTAHSSGGAADSLIRRPVASDASDEWVQIAETYYSVPSWIIKLWFRDFGRGNTEQMLEGLYEARPLCARVNLTWVTRDELLELWRKNGISCAPFARELPECGETSGWELPECGVTFTPERPVVQMPGFKEGYFYVQDTGSMMAGALAPLNGGDRVLDLCAAPGGKATHMAERLACPKDAANKASRAECAAGEVLACDISASKLPLMQENAARLGLQNISFMTADASLFNPKWKGKWDVVLADVPCSGLGVIGHKPDIKMRLKPQDIDSLVRLQRSILENAVRYVRPGGHLVYSTCTACRAENDAQVEWLLQRFPQMHLIRKIQLLPGVHERDGFFMALFEKEQEAGGPEVRAKQ